MAEKPSDGVGELDSPCPEPPARTSATPKPNWVVYGIDVGSYAVGRGFAWYRLDAGAVATPPTHDPDWHDPICLAEAVSGDLANADTKVAIGLEGPISIPCPSGPPNNASAIRARFPAEKSHLWYVSAGATVLALGVPVLADLITTVQAGRAGVSLQITDDLGFWQNHSDSILVYESFLPRTKPSSCGPCNKVAGNQQSGNCSCGRCVISHEWDAYVTALLLFEHNGTKTHLQTCMQQHAGGLQQYHHSMGTVTSLWPLAVAHTRHASPVLGTGPPLTLGWN